MAFDTHGLLSTRKRSIRLILYYIADLTAFLMTTVLGEAGSRPVPDDLLIQLTASCHPLSSGCIAKF